MSKTTESIDDIYALMDRDGKVMPTVSTRTFLLMCFVGVPLFLCLLPLAFVTQVVKAIIGVFLPKPDYSIDTGTVVKESEIIPRKKRKYDVVVLGATGFTGKFVVEHLCKTYGVNKEVKWAIAGRSQSKLEQVKKDVATQLGTNDALSIDTLTVDTNVASTLPTLVKDTRAVVTTAGPFQKYGANVVESCAKYGTHYADITGEIEWVKNMMVKWQETAQQTGAKIVSLCGHDSIPWDLTVMKLEQALPDGEELVSVDCLDEEVMEFSGGSFDTALLGTSGKAMPAPKFDFDPLLMLPDGTKSECTATFEPPLLVEKVPPIHGRFASSYSAFFFLTPINAEVVKRSAALRQQSKNIVYRESLALPDYKTAFCIHFGTFAFAIALLNPLTSKLLQKYVLPKPGQGPSREAMEKKHFLTISAQGVGSKGSKVNAVMYFDKDCAYMDTARMLAESGLVLACDSDKLSPEGGFFTPSTGGMGNILLDRLCRTGTHFVMSDVKTTS